MLSLALHACMRPVFPTAAGLQHAERICLAACRAAPARQSSSFRARGRGEIRYFQMRGASSTAKPGRQTSFAVPAMQTALASAGGTCCMEVVPALGYGMLGAAVIKTNKSSIMSRTC